MNKKNNYSNYRLSTALALMLIFSTNNTVFASEEGNLNNDEFFSTSEEEFLNKSNDQEIVENSDDGSTDLTTSPTDTDEINQANDNAEDSKEKMREDSNPKTNNINDPIDIDNENKINNNIDSKEEVSKDTNKASKVKLDDTNEENLVTVVKDPTYPSYIPLDKIDQNEYYIFGQYKNNRDDGEDRATYTFYIDRNDPYQKVYINLKKINSEGKEFEKVYSINYNGELNIKKLATNISRNELEISALDKKNTGESTFGTVKENTDAENQENKSTTYDIPLRTHHTTHFLDADTDNDIHSPVVASGFFGQDITPPQAPKNINKDGITYEYTGKSIGLDKFSENYKILQEANDTFEYYIGKDKKQKVEVKRAGDQSIIDITTYDQDGNVLKTYKGVKENDKILNDLDLSYEIINENPVIYSNTSKIYYYKKFENKAIDNPNNKDSDELEKNKDVEENYVDKDYKKEFLSNLLNLSKLSNTEKAKFEERINLAKSNDEIYKIYNEAINLNNARTKNESSNTDNNYIIDDNKSKEVNKYPFIKDESNVDISKESINKIKEDHKNSNNSNNSHSLIYIPDDYKYVKKGFYFKEDLLKDYYNLKQAILENECLCKTCQHLLSDISSLSKKYSDKINKLITQSKLLCKEGKMALKEYCKILEIDN
ncbi:MAG: hypothetical protein E7C89_00965 [Anaerococcus sp.]|uniref:hypothetical protein n=1 Tax=Anaerococcus sp. TaxID=1872515 RepID=UPI0029006A46|nr:hypothetical protein [Anaerococcus sp.]MDU2565150.1 hypothetical protein [Anaerococcus sp.]